MNICIIGYGRFGKLLTEILSPHGRIFVISRSRIQNRKVKQIDYKDLEKMDWVIPAVPIFKTEETLQKINPHLKPGSLVMDVCSVKNLPCKWLKKHIGKSVQILGTHPMFGPDSAKYGLEGLQVVMCPLRISSGKYNQIKRIFRTLKLKVIEKAPKEHDRQAARSLSLVHFLGRALGEMKIKQQEISTLGYERLLGVNETVNNDTWQLFYDIQKFNPYAEKERKKLRESLQQIEKKIDQKNI